MRKALLSGVAALAVTAAVLAPGSSSTAAVAKGLTWAPCPADVYFVPGLERLECSTVQVPLDYQNPSGRQIELAISRVASTRPDKKRGVLLTNPGGPGSAGLSMPGLLMASFVPSPMPRSVQDAYDVIGFDPRGVGHSTPVTCDLTEAQIGIGNLPYPKNSADVVKQAAIAKAEAKQCATSSTAYLLPHMTTANTARDMDRIREALGQPKISYLGVSYGTYLGAVYTTLFPQRSDRIVLDSNLGPDGYDIEAMRGFGRGMQDRFPDLAKYAAAHPEFGLGTTPAQVTAKYYATVAKLDRKPVGPYNGSIFRGLIFGHLYSDGLMKIVVESWQSLDRGKEPPAPPTPPTDPTIPADNLLAARFHIICGESKWPTSVLSYQIDVAVDRIRHPLIGAGAANISACAYWPTTPGSKVRISSQGTVDVLMLQNTRDPGTPLVNARKLRRAFGDRARMITVDGGGHGAYALEGNKCGNNAVNNYLLSGKRPDDTFCPAEPEAATK
jgi:pimeloyl-ACP methyl ester carboxylesterase